MLDRGYSAAEKKSARVAFEALRALLDEPDKKKEALTDDFVRALCVMLGFNDCKESPVILRPQADHDIKLPSLKYTALTDFDFQKPSAAGADNISVAFCENKRQLMSTTFAESVSQKGSEFLAVILKEQTRASGFRTQCETGVEIFGFCVQYRHASFWRGLLPFQYVEKIGREELKQDEFGILQCFPVSTMGLDMADLNHRRDVCRYLLSMRHVLDTV